MLSLLLFFLHRVFLPPFLFILFLVLCLASFGKSLGIRRLYVKTLLKVFQFATKVADEARAEQRRNSRTLFSVGEESEDEDGPNQKVKQNGHLNNEDSEVRNRREALKKYGKESRHNVISRKDQKVLNPDQPPLIQEIEEEDESSSNGLLSSKDPKKMSANSFQHEFQLDNILDYVKTGIGSIIEDEVTQRFVAEELKMWNLLTRTSTNFEFVNFKLTVIWIMGFIVRYCILLPGRMCILLVGFLFLSVGMSFISPLPEGPMKRWLHYQVYTVGFQIMGGVLSAVITYHNPENKPEGGGICVANHTSPIDVVILACDNAYALIGQLHSGVIGSFQRVLSRSASHIWFERSESKDRELVIKRLSEHVQDPNKLPILIFPEGTCINNTSVMQFKKGSFEVGGTIYPVAIKYDPIFGDAFWNSSQNGMASYIYLMMTSWAIVCDVWYLPPMTKGEDEDAVAFANRVKSEIARQGGLVDLMWDGNLKRSEVKPSWKAKQQEAFSKSLKVE